MILASLPWEKYRIGSQEPISILKVMAIIVTRRFMIVVVARKSLEFII